MYWFVTFQSVKNRTNSPKVAPVAPKDTGLSMQEKIVSPVRFEFDEITWTLHNHGHFVCTVHRAYFVFINGKLYSLELRQSLQNLQSAHFRLWLVCVGFNSKKMSLFSLSPNS